MAKLIGFAVAFMLAISSSPLFAAGNDKLKPLEIGVVPYLSARVLVTSYEPMRLYLEQALGRPVKIYTAAGFKPFFLNTRQGDYDLVITAAHFARILQKEQKFMPLARYSAGGRGLVMTALNSPLETLQNLRGQVIAVPDQLSLATIVCMSHLRENGLKPATDFKVLEVPSFASAILSVQKGEASAAVSAPGALAQMAPELRESVQPLVDTGEFISLVFLAHPRLGKKLEQLLSKELLKFGNDTSEGKKFFTSNGFGGIVTVTTKDMKSLDRYIADTKRLLDETP
ncbi:MAG: phosphate/phosphite/phosphonate ABC transporter substrate-binding protein [Gallionellaceae bacterium]|jgi:phosphonate transport system substrate-binding protein